MDYKDYKAEIIRKIYESMVDSN